MKKLRHYLQKFPEEYRKGLILPVINSHGGWSGFCNGNPHTQDRLPKILLLKFWLNVVHKDERRIIIYKNNNGYMPNYVGDLSKDFHDMQGIARDEVYLYLVNTYKKWSEK